MIVFNDDVLVIAGLNTEKKHLLFSLLKLTFAL
jgi:hypothetical protein